MFPSPSSLTRREGKRRVYLPRVVDVLSRKWPVWSFYSFAKSYMILIQHLQTPFSTMTRLLVVYTLVVRFVLFMSTHRIVHFQDLYTCCQECDSSKNSIDWSRSMATIQHLLTPFYISLFAWSLISTHRRMHLQRVVYTLSRIWVAQEFYQSVKRYDYHITSPDAIPNIEPADSISLPPFNPHLRAEWVHFRELYVCCQECGLSKNFIDLIERERDPLTHKNNTNDDHSMTKFITPRSSLQQSNSFVKLLEIQL